MMERGATEKVEVTWEAYGGKSEVEAKRKYDVEVSGRHMVEGKRVSYEGGTVSGGQVCSSERWRGIGRCDRQRREVK
jgi:hypothetical protein